jgi:hypothetical protein
MQCVARRAVAAECPRSPRCPAHQEPLNRSRIALSVFEVRPLRDHHLAEFGSRPSRLAPLWKMMRAQLGLGKVVDHDERRVRDRIHAQTELAVGSLGLGMPGQEHFQGMIDQRQLLLDDGDADALNTLVEEISHCDTYVRDRTTRLMPISGASRAAERGMRPSPRVSLRAPAAQDGTLNGC